MMHLLAEIKACQEKMDGATRAKREREVGSTLKCIPKTFNGPQ
jgi:hypothetical protein